MNARRTVWLDDDVARCRGRTEPCTRSDYCARELAEVPKYKATIADFSMGIATTVLGQFCGNFISVDDAVKPAVQTRVKPPIGGAP